MEFLYEVIEMFLKLTVIGIANICEDTKTIELYILSG